MRGKGTTLNIPGSAIWKRELICAGGAPESRGGPKNESYKGTDISFPYRCPFSQQLLPQVTAGPWVEDAQGP